MEIDERPKALSLLELKRERAEMQRDWEAFVKAYDVICKRLLESNEVEPARVPLLHTWSGASAVTGSLELSINAIRRTRDEYDYLIQKVESGEIENTDRPTLRLVE